MDLDVPALLVDRGFDKFAYNRKIGLFHTHITHLSQIFSKRKRNLERNYLKDIDKRYFTWINFSNKSELLKIFIWILYSYSIVFPFIVGIIKALKYRKAFFLWYEPVVTVIETTAVIYATVTHSSRMQFIRKVMS
jgi:hypothetical protein